MNYTSSLETQFSKLNLNDNIKQLIVRLIVGSVGYGKSTLRKYFEGKGIRTIGFDEQEETCAPVVKNNKTWGGLVANMADGTPVAIENGGGAFMQKQNFTAGNEISKRLSENVKIVYHLFVPFELLNACTAGENKQIMLEQVLKEFRERTKKIILQRKQTGMYSNLEGNGLANIFWEGPLCVTARNFPIQINLIEYFLKNNLKVVGFNRADAGAFEFTEPLVIIKNPPVKTNNITYGFNTEFDWNKQIHTGHITIAYNTDISEGFKFKQNNNELIDKLMDGIIIVIKNTEKEGNGAFIVDLSQNPELTKLCDNKIPHMSGNVQFPSYLSEDVLKHYNEGVKLIDLPEITKRKVGAGQYNLIKQDEIVKIKLADIYIYCLHK